MVLGLASVTGARAVWCGHAEAVDGRREPRWQRLFDRAAAISEAISAEALTHDHLAHRNIRSVSMKDFAAISQSLRRHVDTALEHYSQAEQDCPAILSEAMRHSLLSPGKRLRALLVLMAAEACGCSCGVAMPAACAVEMVHTYSLIHDDLPAMDNDDMRRGRPACHVKYGEALAILAGDALLTRAFEVLARDVQPPAVAARCCAELGRAAGPTALVGGQVDDIRAQEGGGDLALLEAIHRRKTGALMTVSLRLGGLVAQADDTSLQALEQFGQKLGLAFQIVDDLLDLRGNEVVIGKRVGKDSSLGKLTFPALLGVDASERRAVELVDQACSALRPFADRGSCLTALARYVVERTR